MSKDTKQCISCLLPVEIKTVSKNLISNIGVMLQIVALGNCVGSVITLKLGFGRQLISDIIEVIVRGKHFIRWKEVWVMQYKLIICVEFPRNFQLLVSMEFPSKTRFCVQ